MPRTRLLAPAAWHAVVICISVAFAWQVWRDSVRYSPPERPRCCVAVAWPDAHVGTDEDETVRMCSTHPHTQGAECFGGNAPGLVPTRHGLAVRGAPTCTQLLRCDQRAKAIDDLAASVPNIPSTSKSAWLKRKLLAGMSTGCTARKRLGAGGAVQAGLEPSLA